MSEGFLVIIFEMNRYEYSRIKSGELILGKSVGLSEGFPAIRFDMKWYEYSRMKSGDLECCDDG